MVLTTGALCQRLQYGLVHFGSLALQGSAVGL